MVILVDDEDRENEGDLTMAAENVTPEAINFMAVHGRGLICLALTEEHVDRLELPMMQSPGRSGPPLGTAFTVSIEARTGVTTGISAADRAHTIRTAVAPRRQARRPGHAGPRVSASRAHGAACSCAPAKPRGRSISRGSPGLAPGGRHLRDHERRRHHGAEGRSRAFRAEARPHHRARSPTSSSTACRPRGSCGASRSSPSRST